MKLTKLTIKNFRGIYGEDNSISFENSEIIFLIGQNNVGKSSFLRAYEFFIAPKQKATKEDFFNHDTINPVEIEAEFEVDPETDKNDEDLQKSGKDKDPEWMSKWMNSENRVKIKKLWKKVDEEAEKFTFNPKDGGKWVSKGFGGFDTLITKYAPTPIPINAMETETSLEEKINKLISDEMLKRAKENFSDQYDVALKAIKKLEDDMLSSEQIKGFNININNRFKEVFANLELTISSKGEDTINLLKALEKHHSLNIKKDGVSRDEGFLCHGHGVIRQALFNFIAFLNEISGVTDKKYILLFEEPELYLHPKVLYNLRKSLYTLAKSSAYQVLCATHSPLMIDVSQPHSSLVRIVKTPTEETITYQVGDNVFGKEENKRIIMMLNKMNSHVCEAFYANSVILVEGETEQIAFRTLLEKYFPKEEVFVLSAGSKTIIPFFQEVLTHFHIEHFVIHDSDSPGKKSVWTLNKKIWGQIEKSRLMGLKVRRYVMIRNFEEANDYEMEESKGKPLSAFEFADSLKIGDKKPCLTYLKYILNKEVEQEEHTQTWLESQTINDII